MSEPLAPELLKSLYRTMLAIRRYEERLADDFHSGKLPFNVHLCVGQEAAAAGVCAHLSDTDWLSSTHRGHGHFIAKGGDPKTMIAEIFAKDTGICRGMGGSPHVADFSKGIIGANGIVGGGIPIGLGAALAAQLEKKDQVCVCFFGDGAANQGMLMESLNIATLWKLPLVLVCEHNGYSEFSPAETVTAGVIADRGKAFGIPSVVVDGNDVEQVYTAAGEAISRARAGEGPSLIQADTYRLFGHNEAETGFLASTYREDEEVEEWRVKDPLPRLQERLKALGLADDAYLDAVNTEILEEVESSFQFAYDSPSPPIDLPSQIMFYNQAP